MRADHQTFIAKVRPACAEGEQDKRLAGEPVHGPDAQGREGRAICSLEAGLVGGQIVPDAHAVGIAPAHVVFREIHADAVSASDDLRLLDKASAVDRITDLKAGGGLRPAGHFHQLRRGGRDKDTAACSQCRLEICGQEKTFQYGIANQGMNLISIQVPADPAQGSVTGKTPFLHSMPRAEKA